MPALCDAVILSLLSDGDSTSDRQPTNRRRGGLVAHDGGCTSCGECRTSTPGSDANRHSLSHLLHDQTGKLGRVLVLVEQGLLALDDSIATLPEFANLGVCQRRRKAHPTENDVTIRDLLRHTSGDQASRTVRRQIHGGHPLFSPDQTTMLQE